jgi:hypothetical protein
MKHFLKDEGKTIRLCPQAKTTGATGYLETAGARLLYGEPKVEPIPRIVEDQDETAS